MVEAGVVVVVVGAGTVVVVLLVVVVVVEETPEGLVGRRLFMTKDEAADLVGGPQEEGGALSLLAPPCSSDSTPTPR